MAIRKDKKTDPAFLARALDRVTEKTGGQLVFIPFQSPQDVAASREVMDKMKNASTLVFRECRPRETMGLVKQMDLVIGMRLHSLIYAVNDLVPAIGLSYDPKVESFMEEVGLPYFPAASFDVDEFVSSAAQLLDNRTGVVHALDQMRSRLLGKAMTNFGMMNMIMGG